MTSSTVWEAIRSLRFAGVPAIGIAAAFGAGAGGQKAGTSDIETLRLGLLDASATLENQPADGRQPVLGASTGSSGPSPRIRDSMGLSLLDRVLAEAQAIADEDKVMCRAIGRFGRELVGTGQGILTHCNAGGLATADYGTALAVIFAAQSAGKSVHVYADETRPLLQGARLTTWELQRHGIPVTLICDNMAAQVMKRR